MGIHPSAVISPGAEIGSGVKVGPYCTIGDHVVIGSDTEIGAHVIIDGRTEIGERNRIYPFSTLGMPPQDIAYRGEDTRLVIGSDNVIREYVTINRATTKEEWETVIGNHNYIMAYAHIAHDCYFYLIKAQINEIIANHEVAKESFEKALALPSILGPSIGREAAFKRAQYLQREYEAVQSEQVRLEMVKAWNDYIDKWCNNPAGRGCRLAKQAITRAGM